MSESFWDFSVRTYRTTKVPEACLSLQDERGVDVNILLYCLWFGRTRGRQSAAAFQDVFEFSESWAGRVVRPLRKARIWMKASGCADPRMPTDTCMSFRDKVKGLELNAEKIQQEVLQSLSLKVPETEQSMSELLAAMTANVRQYFDTTQIVMDEFVQGHLCVILEAAVPGLDGADIQRLLRTGN